jgi:hypothetical protein
MVTTKQILAKLKAANSAMDEWNESEHKRAPNGQFGSGGANTSGARKGNGKPNQAGKFSASGTPQRPGAAKTKELEAATEKIAGTKKISGLSIKNSNGSTGEFHKNGKRYEAVNYQEAGQGPKNKRWVLTGKEL